MPYHNKYLPDIAFGVQDLGGAANHYDNYYCVIDKQYKFIRASLGYGSSNSTTKRMDGIFGGVELQATPWLYLMAENDTKENHLGLKVDIPKSYRKYFNLQGLLSYNLEQKETSIGVTLDIPLKHSSEKITQKYYQKKIKQEKTLYDSTLGNDEPFKQYIEKNEPDLTKNWKLELKNDDITSTKQLQDALDKFGFENVSIATKDETIYIKAENSIFDHNDLDAIGYILGKLAFSKLNYKNFTLILLKNNLQTIAISGKTKDIKDYYSDASISNESKLKNSLSFSRDFDTDGLNFSKKSHSSFFIPRVEFSLVLPSKVGTEYGVFDYVAMLKTNLYMNIYDGAYLSLRYDTPFAWSDDYKEGKRFSKDVFHKNNLVNVLYNQTFHTKNILSTFSIGRYQLYFNAILNHTNYTSTSGEHSIDFKGGILKSKDDNLNIEDIEYYYGSYRYNYAPLDLYAEITYGKYFFGDTGTKFEIKRFFGETSFSFYYTNTVLNGADEEKVGAAISFPITTRKLYRAKYFQIKGRKDWSYGLNTTINREDGTNMLNEKNAVLPTTDLKLKTQYLNRDRLSSGYITNHLDRLRESYITYTKDKNE